jgi:hypothetical protein
MRDCEESKSWIWFVSIELNLWSDPICQLCLCHHFSRKLHSLPLPIHYATTQEVTGFESPTVVSLTSGPPAAPLDKWLTINRDGTELVLEARFFWEKKKRCLNSLWPSWCAYQCWLSVPCHTGVLSLVTRELTTFPNNSDISRCFRGEGNESQFFTNRRKKLHDPVRWRFFVFWTKYGDFNY